MLRVWSFSTDIMNPPAFEVKLGFSTWASSTHGTPPGAVPSLILCLTAPFAGGRWVGPSRAAFCPWSQHFTHPADAEASAGAGDHAALYCKRATLGHRQTASQSVGTSKRVFNRIRSSVSGLLAHAPATSHPAPSFWGHR